MTKEQLRRLANVVVLSNIGEKWGEADAIALSTFLREAADKQDEPASHYHQNCATCTCREPG